MDRHKLGRPTLEHRRCEVQIEGTQRDPAPGTRRAETLARLRGGPFLPRRPRRTTVGGGRMTVVCGYDLVSAALSVLAVIGGVEMEHALASEGGEEERETDRAGRPVHC